MKSQFELFIARRYLRAKRKQAVISIITVISIVGVAAGVMALVITLAVNNGFRSTLQRMLLGAYAHVNIMEKQPEFGISNWRELIAKLKRVPHVVAASPVLYDQVSISSGQQMQGVVLKGVVPKAAVETTDMLRNLKAGSAEYLTAGSGYPGIILGSQLAQALGVKMNMVVNVTSPPSAGEMTPMAVLPNARRFRVVGIFETGFWDIDSSWAITSLSMAQRLLSLEDVINRIELKLDDLYKAPEVARAADKIVGSKLAATTWMQENRPIMSALKMEKAVTFVTVGLIVLVAALNILITLAMMVMEKTRDIAILVSMGAKARQIRGIFIYQGLLIGVVGTAIGLTVAHVLCYFANRYRWIPLDEEVYQLSFVPFNPRWMDSVTIALLAVVISYLATVYPARNASRIAPAEALRYE